MPISDTRLVIVAPPLKISGLASNNQLLMWDSVPGVNYQVLATTNLSQPFQPISGSIPEPGQHHLLLRPESGAAKVLRNPDGAMTRLAAE